MVKDDALYEIAQTDAWRHLLEKIEVLQYDMMGDLLRVAAKKDATIGEIKQIVGRIEGIKAVLGTLGGKSGKRS